MPYLRLDDRAYDLPPYCDLSLDEIGLDVLGCLFASANLSDGFVTTRHVRALGGESVAERLVAKGLWRVVENGFVIADYCDRHASRAKIEQLRAAKAEAGKKGGARSGETRSKRSPKHSGEAPASTQAKHLLHHGRSSPTPSPASSPTPNPAAASSSAATAQTSDDFAAELERARAAADAAHERQQHSKDSEDAA